MDKAKPFLSGLFFLGLSLWGFQPVFAATVESGVRIRDSFAPSTAELPNINDGLPADSGLRDYALSLFDLVRSRTEDSFQHALTELTQAGDFASQSGVSGMLEIVFQPIIHEAKAHDLKAALPSATWLFLSGIFGVLGIKKRKTSLGVDSR